MHESDVDEKRSDTQWQTRSVDGALVDFGAPQHAGRVVKGERPFLYHLSGYELLARQLREAGVR